MKKTLYHIFSFLLCISIGLPLFPTAYADQMSTFSDTHGHWAEEAIEVCVENDLIKGFQDGTFRPDEPVTRAQLAAILNRLFEYPAGPDLGLLDVAESDWYYRDVSTLANWRIVRPTAQGFVNPNEAVVREEAAYMIAESAGLRASALVYSKEDPVISKYAEGHVREMINGGYMVGYPDGDFHPKDIVTRAQIAKILVNMFNEIITEPGTYTYTAAKHILIKSANVTLNLTRLNPKDGHSIVFIAPNIADAASITIKGGDTVKNPYQDPKYAMIYWTAEGDQSIRDRRPVITPEDSSTVANAHFSYSVMPVVKITTPKLERMAIAMYSYLVYHNGGLFTVFPSGGQTSDKTSVSRLISDLESSWGITDRASMIETIVGMTDAGHNISFMLEAMLTDDEDDPQLAEWSEKWGDKGIIGWDLFRMAFLARCGVITGYLTHDEALALFEPAAKKLTINFDTWEEAIENYVDGYAWWSRGQAHPDVDFRRYGSYSLRKIYPDAFDDRLLSEEYGPLQYQEIYDRLIAELNL